MLQNVRKSISHSYRLSVELLSVTSRRADFVIKTEVNAQSVLSQCLRTQLLIGLYVGKRLGADLMLKYKHNNGWWNFSISTLCQTVGWFIFFFFSSKFWI